MATVVPTIAVAGPAEQQGNYRAEFLEGLRFIRNDRLTLVLVSILIITNFLDAAKSSVILPVVAREVYGNAVALGLMFGMSGGGAVIGALVFSAIGNCYSRRWIFVCGFVVASLPMLIIAWLPPLPIVLLAQAISGLAAGPINPILSTIQYERVPAAMRGRVFGVITAGAYVAMPLGVLLAGYLVELVGVQAALVVGGICYLTTTVSLVFNAALKQMDAKQTAEPREIIAVQ